MQIISVDIGNSAVKVGFEKQDSSFAHHRFESLENIKTELLPDSPCLWSVCSVNENTCLQLKQWQNSNRPRDHFHVIGPDEIPIESNVDDRASVGRDRLVAAWRANSMRPENEDLVIVDAGTAVTIDYVDKFGVFQGGVIFPGAMASLSSLASTTHNLEDFTQSQPNLNKIFDQPIGKNTRDAILSRVLHTQLFAIVEIAQLMACDQNVVTTGGQTDLLKSHLPNSWKISKHLVLQGAADIGRLLP